VKLPTLDQMTDILDIKPIVKISLLWVWIILLVLLALALYAIYRKFQRKEKPVPVSLPPRVYSPREKALRELEALDHSGLIEQGQYRKFYFRLSEIVRRFLEEEISLPAVDATTEEIRPHLRASAVLSQDEIKTMENILVEMDLVKFARYSPLGDELRRLRQEVQKFVSTAPSQVSSSKFQVSSYPNLKLGT
jgi:hypothetical protein